MAEERKKVWVDRFQTKLSMRIGAYLGLFFVVFCNFLFAWKMIDEGPVDPARQFVEVMRANIPVIICILILVPVMAWDAIKFTHRLVGPIVRFRSALQSVAKGEPIRPIKLRQDDYLEELRDDFNMMLEELQKRGVPTLKPADPAQEKSSSKQTA